MGGHLCLLSFYVLFILTDGASEGDLCNRRGKAGVCRNLDYCQEAIDDIDSKLIRPQFCGFSDSEAIVCCVEGVNLTGYKPLRCNSDSFNVKKLDDNLKPKRIGRKARDKCIEYQETLVYPCQKQSDKGDGIARSDHCRRDPTAKPRLAGSRVGHADYGEYPHMVLIAVNNTGLVVTEVERYICSGVLLSEKFVLTSEPCNSKTDHPDRPARYVLLNALDRLTTLESANERWYLIGKVHHHPDFDSKSSSLYHDIILLETEKAMELDHYAVPACLPVFNNMDTSHATFLGWGISTFEKYSVRDTLQKLAVDEYPMSTCKPLYNVYALKFLPDGIKETTQVCYGTKGKNTGACQGNAGAALVVENQNVHCMYTVIGILSFGRECGGVDKPDVFTRITGYIEWIENIVWP